MMRSMGTRRHEEIYCAASTITSGSETESDDASRRVRRQPTAVTPLHPTGRRCLKRKDKTTETQYFNDNDKTKVFEYASPEPRIKRLHNNQMKSASNNSLRKKLLHAQEQVHVALCHGAELPLIPF